MKYKNATAIFLTGKDKTIQEKVKKTNTLCTEALKTKFNTGYDHLKEDLKKIGNIQTIYANFCSDSLELPKTSFLFDKEQGGALNDMCLDLFWEFMKKKLIR